MPDLAEMRWIWFSHVWTLPDLGLLLASAQFYSKHVVTRKLDSCSSSYNLWSLHTYPFWCKLVIHSNFDGIFFILNLTRNDTLVQKSIFDFILAYLVDRSCRLRTLLRNGVGRSNNSVGLRFLLLLISERTDIVVVGLLGLSIRLLREVRDSISALDVAGWFGIDSIGYKCNRLKFCGKFGPLIKLYCFTYLSAFHFEVHRHHLQRALHWRTWSRIPGGAHGPCLSRSIKWRVG